jgi:hypothetical protein
VPLTCTNVETNDSPWWCRAIHVRFGEGKRNPAHDPAHARIGNPNQQTPVHERVCNVEHGGPVDPARGTDRLLAHIGVNNHAALLQEHR